MKAMFLLQLFCTLFMTGLIWFVQVVHYPLFNIIAPSCFAAYETVHCQATTSVVALPMILEIVTSAFFLLIRPRQIGLISAGLGFALTCIIWLATLFFSIPNHSILSSGFNLHAYKELCDFNWIRTIAWTLRSVLMLWWVSSLIEVTGQTVETDPFASQLQSHTPH